MSALSLLRVFVAMCFVAVTAQSQSIPSVLLFDEGKSSDQSQVPCCAVSKQHIQSVQEHPSVIERRNYDVLEYDLTMDWRIPLSQPKGGSIDRRYTGVNRVTLRIDSNATTILVFDAELLKIDSLLFEGQKLNSGLLQVGSQVRILLPKTYNRGDTIHLAFYYTQLKAENPTDYNGFYTNLEGFPWGPNFLDTVQANICYTQSEPNSARAWMPCNDRPYDKARSSIRVLVPQGYTACSNGLLQSHQSGLGVDQHEEFSYSDTTAITTYLMMAAASKYARYDGAPYRRVTDTNQLVPVPIYTWRRDSLDYAANLEWMHNKTVEMLESHSRHYGEYPFAKYGQTLLFPYFSGAMEHQANTTHHRRCLTDRWEGVIAHELMHQWTGNLVTCATWSDIWLNEGGATFGEFLWTERSQGIEAARQNIQAARDRSYFRSDFAMSQPAVYGIHISNLFNNGTTYVKGGWVYYMLRTMLGDSSYFAVMNEYFKHFAHQSIETHDFVHFLESQVPNPKVPFQTFFDQWIYAPGHPNYSARLDSIVKVDNSWDVYIQFNQESLVPGAVSLFTMPVSLRFHDVYSPASYDTTFMNDAAQQSLRIRLPFNPRRFVIDEDQLILCTRTAAEIPVSVEASELSSGALQVYPNPATASDNIRLRYHCEQSAPVYIELLDATGRLVRSLRTGYMEAGDYEEHIQATQLSSGCYSVRVRIGEKIYFSTFIIAS